MERHDLAKHNEVVYLSLPEMVWDDYLNGFLRPKLLQYLQQGDLKVFRHHLHDLVRSREAYSQRNRRKPTNGADDSVTYLLCPVSCLRAW
jgi:hypothetical protein